MLLLGGLILINVVLIVTKNVAKYKNNVNDIVTTININNNESVKILTEEELLNIFFKEKEEINIFLAKVFQIDVNTLVSELRSNVEDIRKKDNYELFVIDYLFNLEESNKELFVNKHIPCNDSKEYIEALIKYFSTIYSDVNFAIAAGIAKVESNFTARGMLYKNNIFGGMSSGRLISYKNIEYGILRYVKLLNDGYFQKGLNTIESIGKIYNPMYNEQGIKVAKPNWVYNVNKATKDYLEYKDVDVNVLNLLKNNS